MQKKLGTCYLGNSLHNSSKHKSTRSPIKLVLFMSKKQLICDVKGDTAQ